MQQRPLAFIKGTSPQVTPPGQIYTSDCPATWDSDKQSASAVTEGGRQRTRDAQCWRVIASSVIWITKCIHHEPTGTSSQPPIIKRYYSYQDTPLHLDLYNLVPCAEPPGSRCYLCCTRSSLTYSKTAKITGFQ